MFAFDGVATDIYFDVEFKTMLVMGAVFGFIAAFGRIEEWWMNVLTKEKQTWILIGMIVASIIFTMICIASITSSGFNPFIYFRF
jgi:Mg/Co/Ni transporter MgtE